MQSHIRKVYVCLAVTCHLHFWQNDRDLLRATAVTRGWNGYRNKSQHRKSTLEKKILPPLLQGFEPTTFQPRVRRSNHWAIPAPCDRSHGSHWVSAYCVQSYHSRSIHRCGVAALPLPVSHSTWSSGCSSRRGLRHRPHSSGRYGGPAADATDSFRPQWQGYFGLGSSGVSQGMPLDRKVKLPMFSEYKNLERKKERGK